MVAGEASGVGVTRLEVNSAGYDVQVGQVTNLDLPPPSGSLEDWLSGYYRVDPSCNLGSLTLRVCVYR